MKQLTKLFIPLVILTTLAACTNHPTIPQKGFNKISELWTSKAEENLKPDEKFYFEYCS